MNILSKLNSNKLSRDLKMLLFINILYVAASGLSSIFLNVFILKMSDMNAVIEYNIYGFAAVPFIFVLAGWMSKRVGHRINLILGMALSVIFYLLVILFRYSLVEYIPLVGLMKSVSLGFYYMAYNVLTYDFSDENNRDYFLGINGLTNSLASMVFPVVAGYIIWALPGMRGYEVIFVLSFLLLLFGTIATFEVPNVLSKAGFKLFQTFKIGALNANFRNMLASDAINAARGAVVNIVLSIFIFEVVKNESTVGNYSFWVYLAGTLGSYIGGLMIKPKNRHSYLLLGTIAIALVSAVFLNGTNVLILYVFGITNAVFDAWVVISNSAIAYTVISQVPESGELRTEIMISREFSYFIGRMISLGVFMAVSSRNDHAAILFAVLGIIQVLRWALLRRAGKIA